VQIRTTAVPSKRVSVRHCLLVAIGRREGLATGYHDQADSSWYPGLVERTKCERSCSSGSLHNILVSPYILSHITVVCLKANSCLAIARQTLFFDIYGNVSRDEENDCILFFSSQNRLEYEKRVKAQARAMAPQE